MLRVLKPENKHICINARGRKPANKLVQVVDDGGMNRAPREGKSLSRKAEWWLEDAQAVPVSPFLQGCARGLSHRGACWKTPSNKTRGYRWHTCGTRQCQPNWGWWYPAAPASLGQRVGKETIRGAQGISVWENTSITDLGQCST